MAFKVVSCASLFTIVASASLEGEVDWSNYTYEQYLQDFKDGDSRMASEERRANFEATLEYINKHNAQNDKTWFATVNKFADWSPEEFQSHVKGKVSPPTMTARSLAASQLLDSLPKSVDWREKSVVSDVKNQESCGSCWAFASVQAMESHLAIATGEPVQKLSPQQIVSCSPNPNHCGGKGGCEGSIEPLAFNYTQTAGLTLDKYYKYTAETGKCDESKIVPVAYNDGGYEELPSNDYAALITAVATVGPVAIGMAAGGEKWRVYGGGVLSDCNDYDMDHALNLVGYGTEGRFFGTDYWLVRNSWGSDWGEAGFLRVKRHGEGKEPCGTDKNPLDGEACEGDDAPRTYCGECAILSSSSYPTGLRKAELPPGPAPIPAECDDRDDTQDACEADSKCQWCYYDILDVHMCVRSGNCDNALI